MHINFPYFHNFIIQLASPKAPKITLHIVLSARMEKTGRSYHKCPLRCHMGKTNKQVIKESDAQ